MKKYLTISLCAVLAIMALHRTDGGNPYTVSPQESERILNLIFSRSIDIYKKYRGVESRRKEVVQEFDPETNALRTTSEIITVRKDYYYEKPDVTVIAYRKDGTDMKPSHARIMKSIPTYPVFDEKGREHYDIRVADTKTINGKKCYRIQVMPREETSRYFSGNMYFAVNTLEAVFIEGTLAKLSFPMKYFKIELNTGSVDGVPVVSSGAVHVRIRVPIFYPDTMIVSTISVLESKLIQ